jgi:hypothetical protein
VLNRNSSSQVLNRNSRPKRSNPARHSSDPLADKIPP